MSTPPAAVTLPPREAYRLWAPRYQAENALTTLENAAVRAATPSLRGRALLDVGCGTGRRMDGAGPPERTVGVDLVFEMLTAGEAPRGEMRLIAADVRALPLSEGAFDVVWCRLVLGHLGSLDEAYNELARVAANGATLIVTDFHPAAISAGHTRTFRDDAGVLHAVEHHVHLPAQHVAAAARAGWSLAGMDEPAVGPAVRAFYQDAGMMEHYRVQLGLPLVLLLAFVR